tara:strand:- start:10084 stop:10632 length:549 start_codon:yes stop_codon:yes gene_type:complete
VIRARSPFFIEHEESSAPTVLPRFTCADTSITGLSIAANGTITNPSVSVGTLHSIEPTSFGTVTTATVRNVLVYVTFDSSNFRPPTDSSNQIACPVSFEQPATTVAAAQKNFRVTNNSTTETAFLQYTAFDGSVQINHTMQPSETVDICVAPFDSETAGYPTVIGDATYFDLVQGCTTDTLS